MSNKKELVFSLIENGKSLELLHLISGTSEYCDNSEDAEPITKANRKYWQLAMDHLNFLSKYGLQSESVENNSIFEFPYPDEFEKWIELNCPGLSMNELNQYLEKHPEVLIKD